MAFNHVHTPDFASRPYCNTTLRGRSGEIARDDTRDVARAEDGATAHWSGTLRDKTPLAGVESVKSAYHAHIAASRFGDALRELDTAVGGIMEAT